MGEYGREQRNQLSRAVANGETGSKQLKAFVDNRPLPIVCQLIRVQEITEEQITDSLRNIISYTSLLDSYPLDFITGVLRDKKIVIRGHASGGPGDGMNAATRQDIADLTDLLRSSRSVPPAPSVTRGKSKPTPDQLARGEVRAAEKAAKKAARKEARTAYFRSQQGKGSVK